MKRLIICCDGTWNNPAQEDNGVPAPTNVFKFFNAIADDDKHLNVPQLKYYHPGLGTEGTFFQKLTGGAFGAGISRHICSAYHWLARNYEEGDQIYLYGFSRGAFTVRSLGGFLACGLLKLDQLDTDASWERVHTLYRKTYRGKKTDGPWTTEDWTFFLQGQPVPIRFIGVWDTVGALGIPDDLELMNIFDSKDKWQFHDTQLGDHIQTARHAMAIDEMRSSFSITRWSNEKAHPDALELWFPGVHADVGGGYSDSQLAHGALLWMITESAAADLKFRNGSALSFPVDPLGPLHNSFKGIFAKLRSRPRNIPAMTDANKGLFHPGALKRQDFSPINYKPYHPTRILEQGEEFSIDIYAGDRWNETGLYLVKEHSYKFSAEGRWLSGSESCDWTGMADDKLTAGDILRGISNFWGQFEDIYKQWSHNESTDFIGSKRVENIGWLSLTGAVTNDSGSKRAVKNDGSPVPHQYVELCRHELNPFAVTNDGYLYCFANDVWGLYENNRGSIRLTVKRVR